jgi:serine/threonine protein kinase
MHLRVRAGGDVTISGGALTGEWLGDYQLQGVLGIGGMAEVYQARDVMLNREVAVKVLPPALAADPSYVERFRNEAQAVGALNHPNIVPVLVFREQGPYLYLVMPLIKESLRDRLTGGVPLPVADAVQIAVQILSGLGAAHTQGVVHRDVKPENILLDENGVAKLTDFGIARRITIRRASGGPTLAGTGLPVGTPQYMAPEQLRGEDLDQRADIYALGSVLYEMLTGLSPHVADTPYEVASLVLTAPIVEPSSRNPKIWPELEQVMLKALSRKREDRYANATSFAEALQDALLAHDIELIEPASVVKPSYIKFRLSQPPLRSGNGSSVGQGSAEALAPLDPSELPTAPMANVLPAANSPSWPPSNQPRNTVPASAALDVSEQETLTQGAPVVATGPPAQAVGKEPVSLPGNPDGPQGATTNGVWRSGMTIAPADTATASSPDHPTRATGASGGNGGARRRRWTGWVIALTVIVALGLLSAVAISTGVTRYLPRVGFTATPAVTTAPTATTTPTITPTPAPTGTATLTAQQQLDRQASDSFRAITLAKAKDSSCNSNTATFSAGQPLYINMCTSSHVAPGPVTVSIRQMGNVCTLLPDKNSGLTPSASYYCSSTLSLAAGVYDMVISITINGTPAIARTLRFTVGG